MTGANEPSRNALLLAAGHCPVDRPVRPVSEACRTCGLLLAPWLRLYCTKCVQQHLKG